MMASLVVVVAATGGGGGDIGGRGRRVASNASLSSCILRSILSCSSAGGRFIILCTTYVRINVYYLYTNDVFIIVRRACARVRVMPGHK